MNNVQIGDRVLMVAPSVLRINVSKPVVIGLGTYIGMEEVDDPKVNDVILKTAKDMGASEAELEELEADSASESLMLDCGLRVWGFECEFCKVEDAQRLYGVDPDNMTADNVIWMDHVEVRVRIFYNAGMYNNMEIDPTSYDYPPVDGLDDYVRHLVDIYNKPNNT